MHDALLEKMEQIKSVSEKTGINFVANEKLKSKIGIIASGISFTYVMDALEDLKLKLPVLKLGLTYPLPEQKIKKFVKNFKSVLVVEELDDILEQELRAMAKDVNPKLKIFGKQFLPKSGEYAEEDVISALVKITGKKFDFDLEKHSKEYEKIQMARRFPVMCPGCQHRATFYAAKVAAPSAIYGGDIGCYMLGMFPPIDTSDFIFAMGASEGVIHGINKSTDQKTIAFIGDSTFFHAGVPALINAVYNKSNPLIIILDNRATAMTGFQPHPGTGRTGMGEETKQVSIEDIAKACGVENVKVVDPFNLNEMIATIKEFLQKDKVSVIVAKRECQLLALRKKRKEGIAIPKFEIDKTVCTKCGKCLYEFGCPAIIEENNVFRIDRELCIGCTICAQVCPVKAIKMSK
jgi:indolepyruvate ferredoxin oxidoreductase alpha subunit